VRYLSSVPFSHTNATIRRAESHDTPAITRVINAAFRAAESFFIERDRISTANVQAMSVTGTFLVAEAAGDVAACVYVEVRGERAYFGLLATDPAHQRRGLGGMLISAVESYAREHGCKFMDIRVVNLRSELPGLYRRLGYAETGTEPFPADAYPKLPCHFIVMSKPLT
jgi:ribosomal protein S18 acetylase RimI-like enzyme